MSVVTVATELNHVIIPSVWHQLRIRVRVGFKFPFNPFQSRTSVSGRRVLLKVGTEKREMGNEKWETGNGKRERVVWPARPSNARCERGIAS